MAAGDADEQVVGRYGKQKVVYHIDGDGGWWGRGYWHALSNIQNHINAVGAANVDIKVVLNGAGVRLLEKAKDDEKLRRKITALRAQFVQFLVCENTVRARNLDPRKNLLKVESDDIVPSGVAELAHLEELGYRYIKP